MRATLLNDFYTEIASEQIVNKDGSFFVDIQFNPSHAIYKGHFEQMPVVPGVCLIQIIKELAEKKINKQLMLISADNIKFLSVIKPEEEVIYRVILRVQQNEQQLDVSATFGLGDVIYTKFKGKFSL